MIERIEISARHIELTDDLKAYIHKKVGKLDRYIARNERDSVHVEVKLQEETSKNKDKHECEIILHLPSEKITAKDATINVYAAIDIVEAKIRNQLKKHKAKVQNHKADRKGALKKLRKLADKDYWGSQN